MTNRVLVTESSMYFCRDEMYQTMPGFEPSTPRTMGKHFFAVLPSVVGRRTKFLAMGTQNYSYNIINLGKISLNFNYERRIFIAIV